MSILSVLPLIAEVSADSAYAKSPNPGVVPVTSRYEDQSYGELSVAWWQWALAAPLPNNPLVDTDGSLGAIGQSGDVWFLVGNDNSFADLPVFRSLTVPKDKALFFPLINFVWVTIPPNPGYPAGDLPFSEPGAEAFARSVIADAAYGGIDGASVLECEIDGRPLTNLFDFRVYSPVFDVILPADYQNTWGYATQLDHGGLYTDTVSDGYWLLLKPLEEGEHTLHFHAVNGASGFVVDVYYDLTIVEDEDDGEDDQDDEDEDEDEDDDRH